MAKTETKSRIGEDVSSIQDVTDAVEKFTSDLSAFTGDIQSELKQQKERLTMLERKSISAARPHLAAATDFDAPHQKAFDAYLRDGTSLTDEAAAGMELFYGKAQCSTCHSGQFQTDHGFHAIALPQIGPGKAARFERHNRDVGRGRVTGATEDFYRFRTPSLRNITQTAPYGHNGAFTSLEGIVRHHLSPEASLSAYTHAAATFSDGSFSNDFKLMNDAPEVSQIAQANDLPSVSLSDTEVSQILAILESLTDYDAIKGRLGVPTSVPSGLPLDN